MAWMYWCMTAYYHTLNNVVNSFDVVKAGLISRMNSMREIELGDTVAPPPTTTSSFTTTAASIRREKKTKESFNNNNNNNTNDTFGISGGVDATGRTGTGATGYSVNSDTGSVTSQSFSSNDARNAYVIDQLVKRGIIDSSTLEPIENDFNGR